MARTNLLGATQNYYAAGNQTDSYGSAAASKFIPQIFSTKVL